MTYVAYFGVSSRLFWKIFAPRDRNQGASGLQLEKNFL